MGGRTQEDRRRKKQQGSGFDWFRVIGLISQSDRFDWIFSPTNTATNLAQLDKVVQTDRIRKRVEAMKCARRDCGQRSRVRSLLSFFTTKRTRYKSNNITSVVAKYNVPNLISRTPLCVTWTDSVLFPFFHPKPTRWAARPPPPPPLLPPAQTPAARRTTTARSKGCVPC